MSAADSGLTAAMGAVKSVRTDYTNSVRDGKRETTCVEFDCGLTVIVEVGEPGVMTVLANPDDSEGVDIVRESDGSLTVYGGKPHDDDWRRKRAALRRVSAKWAID